MEEKNKKRSGEKSNNNNNREKVGTVEEKIKIQEKKERENDCMRERESGGNKCRDGGKIKR